MKKFLTFLAALAMGCQPTDLDGDGYSGAQDCNEQDDEINAGAREVCNGEDDDCDGDIDQGLGDSCDPDEDTDTEDPNDGECRSDEILVCKDADRDGFADDTCRCIDEDDELPPYIEQDEIPEGDDLDCDDDNKGVNPDAVETCNGADDNCDGERDNEPTEDGTAWFQDADLDGYGNPAKSKHACTQPTNYVAKGTDCDDTKSDIHPDASERCDDIDSDCDGEKKDKESTDAVIWYEDADTDTFGAARQTLTACDQPTGYVGDKTDCDDEDDDVHPGADEICNDRDDDCDGKKDDADTGVLGQTEYQKDVDHDTFGAGAVEKFCTQPIGYERADRKDDCNDSDPTIHPAATETCDSKDNDCDGTTDESGATGEQTFYRDGDLDSYGNKTVKETVCESRKPFGYVLNNTDCNDGRSDVHPGAPEVCGDGIDQDCNGIDDATQKNWYEDADTDTYGNPDRVQAACGKPIGYVADNTDCNDANPDINPKAPEQCNSIDDDCDGKVDESVVQRDWYLDFDDDRFGDKTEKVTDCIQPSGYVTDKTDCDDNDDDRFPGNTEDCDDGVDNDCDLAIDSADSDCGGSGGGSTGAGAKGSLCAADSAQCKLTITCEEPSPGVWQYCVEGNTERQMTFDPDEMEDASGSPLGIKYYRVTVDLNDDGTFASSEISASTYAGVTRNCANASGKGNWRVSLESEPIDGLTQKSGVWLGRAQIGGTCPFEIASDDLTVVVKP